MCRRLESAIPGVERAVGPEVHRHRGCLSSRHLEGVDAMQHRGEISTDHLHTGGIGEEARIITEW